MNGHERLLVRMLNESCENCRADCNLCCKLWDREVAEQPVSLGRFYYVIREFKNIGVLS